MDGQALAFADASFDAVVSMFGWFLFEDRARALAEFYRVLRDGGRVLVTSWLPPDQNTAIGAGMAALRAAVPDMKGPAGLLPTQQPAVLVDELRAAGFRDVEASLVREATTYPSVDAYWDEIVDAGAPLVLLRKRLGDEAWQKVDARVREQLRAQYGSGEMTVHGAAIFTQGVKG
jgi:SAM-dependent methyltransferase